MAVPLLTRICDARPSKCADEALRHRIEREARMTPLERMILALRLGEEGARFAAMGRRAASR